MRGHRLKKIYVDVTQSYIWEGKVTGIIRVMDEISSRFIGDGRFDATFVIWNEPGCFFQPVDYTEALNARGQDHKAEFKKKGSGSSKLGSSRLRSMAARIPLAKPARTMIAAQRHKRHAQKAGHSHEGIEFEKGAVLFMPHGGSWESRAYIEKIQALKKQRKVRLIPIIYDFSPVLTPQFCSEGVRRTFDAYMRKVLPGVDHILSISQNTADDARTWLKSTGATRLPPVSVFRLGDEVGGERAIKPTVQLPERYMLCVGTIEARKNHMALYFAFRLAAENNIELPPVVVVGRKGWLAEDIYEIITTDPLTKEKFVFLHQTSDSQLLWLYQHALFSVYPSFYEGWGLPVAESLLRGVPCLASNVSSLPEIAGDLVEYSSPFSPETLVEKMKKLNDEVFLEKKRKEIAQKYQPTTWDAAYQQVADCLLS